MRLGGSRALPFCVRRYLPKGIDLSDLTQADLRRIEQLLNDRPRRVLGYRTSNEVFDQLLAQLQPLR